MFAFILTRGGPRGRRLALWAGLILLGGRVPVHAEEFSALTGGTVVGRSTGYALGCPGQDLPLVGEADLVVETAFYFKNLELFQVPGVLGETFMAFATPVRLRYRAAGDVTLEMGAVLGHDLGDDDGLNLRRPLLRLVHDPGPRVHLIAGTLLQTHWIHDAILDDVQKFRTGVEQGFQLRADRNHYLGDTWVDWRIREGEVRSEEFEVASAHRFALVGGRLHLDGQFMWTHTGGQISSSGRIEQNLIYLAGLSWGRGRDAAGPCDGWRLGYSWIFDRDETNTKPLDEGTGHELWGRGDVPLKRGMALRLFGSRWWGNDLVSGLGDPLYSLDDYSQAGVNLLITPPGRGLAIEAGFVHQWSGDVRNLTYQLAVTWGRAFRLGRLDPPQPAP